MQHAVEISTATVEPAKQGNQQKAADPFSDFGFVWRANGAFSMI